MISLNKLIDDWIKDVKEKEKKPVVLKPNLDLPSPTEKTVPPISFTTHNPMFALSASYAPVYSITSSYASGAYNPNTFRSYVDHVFSPKSQEVKTLQDNLDQLFNELLDKNDKVVELEKELNALKSESAGSINAWRVRFEILNTNFALAETDYDDLKLEYDVVAKELAKLKSEQVNAEFLARKVITLHDEKTRLQEEYDKNYCEINRLNAVLSIQKKADPSEIIQFKQQVTRLVEENAKLSCPGHYLQEVQKCGKCTACMYEKTNALYLRQKDELAAVKSENKKLVLEQCGENLKNISDMDHLRNIITILMRALNDIITGGVFLNRKSIAEQARAAVKDYRERNNILTMQIHSSHTIENRTLKE